MLLFFILFIFFILHVQFLLRNIFFGTDEATYFYFTVTYLFDQKISQDALLFTIICATSFAVGYLLFYRKSSLDSVKYKTEVDFMRRRGELYILNIAGVVQIVYGIMQLWMSGFSYQVMAESKMNFAFISELRIFFIILLVHLFLNVPWAQIIKRRELRTVRWVLVAYVLITLLGQARSTVFEILAVITITQLMWMGDKIKIKYLLLVAGSLLLPNLIVLGRLGVMDDLNFLIDGLFSFEYLILFNNMLGAVIEGGKITEGNLSFAPSMLLIIPSPIRAMLGVTVEKSGYYSDIADASGVSGGGFSLLAEMFSNFGWYAPLVFFAIGVLLGSMLSLSSKVGRVGLLGAAAPLLYTAFVLSFRNDFGVFLKYAFQLVIIALILKFVLQVRFGK